MHGMSSCDMPTLSPNRNPYHPLLSSRSLSPLAHTAASLPAPPRGLLSTPRCRCHRCGAPPSRHRIAAPPSGHLGASSGGGEASSHDLLAGGSGHSEAGAGLAQEAHGERLCSPTSFFFSLSLSVSNPDPEPMGMFDVIDPVQPDLLSSVAVVAAARRQWQQRLRHAILPEHAPARAGDRGRSRSSPTPSDLEG